MGLGGLHGVFGQTSGCILAGTGDGGSLRFVDPVLDKDLSTPPASPSTGDRYIVAAGGTGAWSGHDDEIAEWSGAAWTFTVPTTGMTTWVVDESEFYVWTGTAWSKESFHAHASTHEVGGTDDIPAENLGTAETTAGKILRTKGSALLEISQGLGLILAPSDDIATIIGNAPANSSFILSPGTYTLTAPVQIKANGVSVVGTYGSVISAPTGVNAIEIDASVGAVSNVHLKGFQVSKAGLGSAVKVKPNNAMNNIHIEDIHISGGAGAGSFAIDINSTVSGLSGLYIFDVIVTGNFAYGVYSWGTAKVERVEVSECEMVLDSSGATGIALIDGGGVSEHSDVSIHNNVIISTGNNGNDGIMVQDSSNGRMLVEGNYIKGFVDGIDVNAGADNLAFVNNFLYGTDSAAGSGISVSSASDDLNISGNLIRTFDRGFNCDGGVGELVFASNYVADFQGYGFRVPSGGGFGQTGAITGNLFVGASAGTTAEGIYIEEILNSTVTGNFIQVARLNSKGISVRNDSTIIGNRLKVSGDSSIGIEYRNAADQHINIQANVIEGGAATGIKSDGETNPSCALLIADNIIEGVDTNEAIRCVSDGGDEPVVIRGNVIKDYTGTASVIYVVGDNGGTGILEKIVVTGNRIDEAPNASDPIIETLACREVVNTDNWINDYNASSAGYSISAKIEVAKVERNRFEDGGRGVDIANVSSMRATIRENDFVDLADGITNSGTTTSMKALDIDDNEFTGITGKGIELTFVGGDLGYRINGNRMHDWSGTAQTAGFAFTVSFATDIPIEIERNVVNGYSSVSSSYYPMELTLGGADMVSVCGNKLEGNAGGGGALKVVSQGGGQCCQNQVKNSVDDGLLLESMTEVSITDNYVEGCGGDGLQLDPATDCVIEGNVVVDNTGFGIYEGSACTRPRYGLNVVEGNTGGDWLLNSGTTDRVRQDPAYGQISVSGNTTAQVLNATPGTFNTITAFDTNGLSRKTTPDHTNDRITLEPGVWKVSVGGLSFSGGANTYYDGAIFLDGTEVVGSRMRRRLNSAGDIGVAPCGQALVKVAQGDNGYLDFRMASDTASASVTVRNAALVAERVG